MTSPNDETTEINERAVDRARELQMEHYLSETDRAAAEAPYSSEPGRQFSADGGSAPGFERRMARQAGSSGCAIR